jgi:two-component system CheB/CheR fusion protein
MSFGIHDRICNGRQSKSWRGLVVDDMPAARRAVGIALSALGGQITTATNGAEAIEIVRLARKSGMDFDIIFTDIQMPVMDGLEATNRIREQGFTGPVIAISGSEDFDIASRCIAAGCDEFIAKPATLEMLASIALRYCHVHVAPTALAYA